VPARLKGFASFKLWLQCKIQLNRAAIKLSKKAAIIFSPKCFSADLLTGAAK